MTFVTALAQVYTPKPDQFTRLLDATSLRFPAFIVPLALKEFRSFATLSHSFELSNDFKYEQTDPDIFYEHLVENIIGLLEGIMAGADISAGTAGTAGSAGAGGTPSGVTTNTALHDKRVLDVGGGPGYLGRAFARRGVEHYTCEPDVDEMVAVGIKLGSLVCGPGPESPFRDDAPDLTYSSNVAEHMPEPWTMDEEMLRVTKSGGLVIYSYTIWYGPFNGHEMGMTHYLGGDRARRMYEKKHGKQPKSCFSESLFKVGCGEGLKWIRVAAEVGDCEPLVAFPRHHPWWVWWVVYMPVLRGSAVSNPVLMLRKQ